MTASDTTDSGLLATLAPALRSGFLAAGYTVDGLEAALGTAGLSALERSDAAAVSRIASGAGSAGELLRLFVLGEPLPRERIAELLPELDLSLALRAGLLAPAGGGAEAGPLAAALDLRPMDIGSGSQWVFSDVDGSMVRTRTRPDHVLGVGQASFSLLNIAPPATGGSVLDLGTGCGVLLLGRSAARRRVATDITPRCLDFAAATHAINGIEAEYRLGSWFEPVAGARFDQILANPPFVIGTDEVGHTYRESGLHLDGATELVLRESPAHLVPGGTAAVLGAWILRSDEDWRSRLASWLPESGVSAWILMRDLSDPEQYAWTWLTDEGGDPRTPEFAEAERRWLEHFEREGVSGVGFGYIYLRAIDGPTEVECEDLSHPFDSGLGAEALAHFERAAWLRSATEEDIDETVFEIAPSVVIYDSQRLGSASGRAGHSVPQPGEGEQMFVVERTSGPRWRHELDPVLARVLRGIEQGGLPLGDIAELVALAELSPGHEPVGLLREIRRAVIDLVRHGIVLPRSLPLAAMEEWLPAGEES